MRGVGVNVARLWARGDTAIVTAIHSAVITAIDSTIIATRVSAAVQGDLNALAVIRGLSALARALRVAAHLRWEGSGLASVSVVIAVPIAVIARVGGYQNALAIVTGLA